MSLSAVDGSKVDSILFGIASSMAGGDKNKMFAVRQKPRPAMGGVLGSVDYGRGFHRAALRAHFRQRAGKIRCENDHIIGAPAPAARIRCFGYGGDRAPVSADLHQLTPRKKPNVAAIGRPERMGSSRSAVEGLRRITVQRADPQQLGFTRMSDECDLVALRGKHGHAASVARGIDGESPWWGDLSVKRHGLFGACPAVS